MIDRDELQNLIVNKYIKEELVSNSFALVVAATGFGKGSIIKIIAEKLKENHTLITVVPRVNLVSDLSARKKCDIYCSSLGKKEFGKITVATKQSLPDDFYANVILADECHQYKDDYLKYLKSKCDFLIGFTATPFTMNGLIYGKNKFWNEPCFNFTIKDCIDNNFLVPYKIFGSDNSFDMSNYRDLKRELRKSEINEVVKTAKHELQVEEFIKICNREKRKKVAVICSDISHAEKVYKEILKYEKAYLIHSKIKNSTELSDSYKKNDIRFSVSVLQLSEGYDNEYIDCIVILRPTKSPRLAVQIIGRGLRLSKNKEYCLILDYAEVCITCGTPHNPIIPGDSKKSQKEESTLRQCESCFYIYDKEIGTTCPSCGHVHKVERDVEKNLKQSIFVDDIETIIIDRTNIYRRSKTKKGIDFMTVKVNGKFHTFYSYQIKSVLSSIGVTGRCKVYYKKEGSQKFKFIKAESFRDPQ